MNGEVPGEPKGEPTMIRDGYEVYVYDQGRETIVPDVYVAKRSDADDEPHLRIWFGEGRGPFLRYLGEGRHQYGEDDHPDDPSDCCSWHDDAELPDAVMRIMARVSDAPIIGGGGSGETE